MTAYTHSLVILCPESHRATIEAIGLQMGHSGNELTVPLSADGSEPATHWGCHAWATETTVYLWTQAEEVPGLTAGQIADIRANVAFSASTELSNRAHFDAACAANGLQRVEPDADPN